MNSVANGSSSVVTRDRDAGHASDAADSIGRELDILLAPLSKHLRYPLPVPEHLSAAVPSHGALDARAAASAATPSRAQRRHGGEADGVTDGAADHEAAVTRAMREQARRDCAGRVDGLQVWQERVEGGLIRGLDCQSVLEHVRDGVASMRTITKSVQDQSQHLSHNASVLVTRKLRLVQVQEELQKTIQHFTHMEDLCREAEDKMVTATSPRFPQLFQELEKEMQFLCRNAQFKSAKVYATRLAVAQQTTTAKLLNALKNSLGSALKEALAADKNPVAAVVGGSAPLQVTDEGMAAAADSDAVVVTHSPSAAVDGVSESVDGDPNDPAVSFGHTLRRLNGVFVAKLEETASLRRMAELRSSFSNTGAEAFGEEPVGNIEDDQMLQELVRHYCQVRVGLVSPLLRNWLRAWCQADSQGQQTVAPLSIPPLSSPGTPVMALTDVPVSPSSPGSTTADGPAVAAPPAEPASPALASSQSTTTAASDGASPREAAARALSLSASQLHGSAGPSVVLYHGATLPQLAGHICTLLEICLRNERDTLDAVWLRSDFANCILPRLVADITEELYHVFRSRLVRLDDLAELADTVEEIQLINMRQASDAGVMQELSRLWLRMIQDVQERMIFRTSVYLRHDVGRGHPTQQLVKQYTDVITAGVDAGELPLVPGVENAVRLLAMLYSTLEFSVFSVFAEEAVQAGLNHVTEVGKMMAAQTSVAPWTEVMSLGIQLLHLLFIRRELSRIDANITVVEKSLDLSKLAKQRKFEIAQSSRESKTQVESEVQRCSTRLSQCLGELVAAPLAGAAHKSAAEVEAALKETEGMAAKGKYLVSLLIAPQHPQTQVALCEAVDRRVAELTREVAELRMSGAATHDSAPKDDVPAAAAPAPPPVEAPSNGVGDV